MKEKIQKTAWALINEFEELALSNETEKQTRVFEIADELMAIINNLCEK